MKAMKFFLFSFAMVLCAFTAAQAIPLVGDMAVDFRTWTGANNHTSWTVGNVTATALPTGSKLYQDNVDGLGVLGGEDDEIDGQEQILVTFDGVMNLRGVWLTDLFYQKEGGVMDGAGDPRGEHGTVLINGTVLFHFYGDVSDQANGEQYIDFGGPYLVTSALFSVVAFNGNLDDNDYSVAGFVGVPEPVTLLLLGFGLVGLAGVRRFKK